MFVTVNHFVPTLIFYAKARNLPLQVVFEKGFYLGRLYPYKTKAEVANSDKDTSLPGHGINYWHQKFYSTGPSAKCSSCLLTKHIKLIKALICFGGN